MLVWHVSDCPRQRFSTMFQHLFALLFRAGRQDEVEGSAISA
jgi:hypothetical protein